MDLLIEKTVKIELDSGLQARPAAYFVQEANRFDSHIFLENDDKKSECEKHYGTDELSFDKRGRN